MTGLEKLLGYSKPYKKQYYSATIFSILNKLFDILPEILIGIAVDTVVKRQDSWIARFGISDVMHQLILLAIITMIIWVLESVTQYFSSIDWRNLGQTIQHNLRIDVYTHLQKLPLGFFENKKTGNLLSIINDDINQIERFIENGINDIIQVIVSTIVIGAIFFYVSRPLAMLAILPIPLLILGSFYFQGHLALRFLDVREKASILSSRLTNNILGIFTIKCFNAEQFEINNIKLESNMYRESNRKAIAWSSLIRPVIRMGVLLGFMTTLLYGGKLAINGEIEIGTFSLLVFLTQRLLWPLTDLADTTVMYQRSMASAHRALSLLDEELPKNQVNIGIKPDNFVGKIKAENLSFAYLPGQNIIDQINFTLEAGSSLAFVGNTGSGKSTIIKLLMGFYEPSAGSMTIDNIAASDFDPHYLRNKISIVSQDIFLFHGTIRDNIAYGLENIELEKIIQAAKLAQIDEFIAELPNGYDTIIAERGQNLSGGQRQRLAIARAIIRDPKILILDEATSAVDNETEYAIQKSIENLSKNRTVIVIAHRLSTIRNIKNILVLEDGKITEQGNHESLIAGRGTYHRLWQIQTGDRA